MASADKAAKVLLAGGVIAYPTEGVFGLGCLPDDSAAIRKLLRIKQRDPAKGLILIAADAAQLQDWIELGNDQSVPEADPAQPITWIVAPGSKVSQLVRGEHESVAVRITTNPVARSICEAVQSPVVSTSANLSGQAVAANQSELQQQFGELVDYIVAGDCGPASGPSEIRVLQTGEVLRPRQPGS